MQLSDTPNRPPHPRAIELAGFMAQLACRGGRAHKDQLLDEGFTPAELDRHGDLARALAARMMKSGQPPFAVLRIRLPLEKPRRQRIADAAKARAGAR